MIWLIALRPYSIFSRAWVNKDFRNPFLQFLQSPLANSRVFNSNIYGGKKKLKAFSSCFLRIRSLQIISGWEYLHLPDGWPLHSIQRVSNISSHVQMICSLAKIFLSDPLCPIIAWPCLFCLRLELVGQCEQRCVEVECSSLPFPSTETKLAFFL